ncbi:MAG: radical SAM protein [Clostridia bacterium]|nr:radical SAM protein [Clostridia bacterium]
MEQENKPEVKQGNSAQNGEQVGGNRNGRRRRHRHKSGGGNPNAQNAQTQQNGQNKQGAQQKQNQNQSQSQQKGQQAQKERNNGNAPKNPQNGQNQQKKNKNKDKQNNRRQEKNDENRKDTYLYALDGKLYVNLTNKCSNGCDFCVRNERTSYYGNYLWIRHGDPTVEKVMSAANGFGDLKRFKEAVFCGFGEPTYKIAEMVALCDFFHAKGLSTRLNTNGQGNLINKRDVVPELKDKIDFVNVSLNASCVEKYQPICRSQFGASGFESMIEFAKSCKKNDIACRFSIVDCIGEEEVEACKKLAESLKIPLHIRKYIADS